MDPCPPAVSLRTLNKLSSGHTPPLILLLCATASACIWEGASHVSSMKRAMNLPLMDRCHMLCPQMWRGRGGGFHTDRINMWKWLTSLYVSDVLWVLYISWEAFSKDMINLQNMVNFPSVEYTWRSASFVDCLACIASMFAACVCVHACKHMSACVHHPCVTTSMMG